MAQLLVHDLTLSRDTNTIVRDLTLSLEHGSVHALLGPNGSGKSTFAHALMGNARIAVCAGTMTFQGVDLVSLSADKRARMGIFLSFQYPPEIPGVSVLTFLQEAYRALHGVGMSNEELRAQLIRLMDILSMDHAFLQRNLNDGFSGGEKKRFEMLQILLFKPRLIILDEIDSGLDIDALKAVGNALALVREQCPQSSMIIITHYQRILQYIRPDYVHILMDGRLVQTGDYQLLSLIEQEGYASLRSKAEHHG